MLYERFVKPFLLPSLERRLGVLFPIARPCSGGRKEKRATFQMLWHAVHAGEVPLSRGRALCCRRYECFSAYLFNPNG